MRIYLAASFELRDKIRPYAIQLWERGHEILSSWLNEVAKPPDMDKATFWRKLAIKDLTEVKAADLLILFAESVSGGKNVELGFALGQFQSKEVWLVGEPTNVFQELVDRKFATWEECLEALR